jgi:hypothetical protein
VNLLRRSIAQRIKLLDTDFWVAPAAAFFTPKPDSAPRQSAGPVHSNSVLCRAVSEFRKSFPTLPNSTSAASTVRLIEREIVNCRLSPESIYDGPILRFDSLRFRDNMLAASGTVAQFRRPSAPPIKRVK